MGRSFFPEASLDYHLLAFFFCCYSANAWSVLGYVWFGMWRGKRKKRTKEKDEDRKKEKLKSKRRGVKKWCFSYFILRNYIRGQKCLIFYLFSYKLSNGQLLKILHEIENSMSTIVVTTKCNNSTFTFFPQTLITVSHFIKA